MTNSIGPFAGVVPLALPPEGVEETDGDHEESDGFSDLLGELLGGEPALALEPEVVPPVPVDEAGGADQSEQPPAPDVSYEAVPAPVGAAPVGAAVESPVVAAGFAGSASTETGTAVADERRQPIAGPATPLPRGGDQGGPGLAPEPTPLFAPASPAASTPEIGRVSFGPRPPAPAVAEAPASSAALGVNAAGPALETTGNPEDQAAAPRTEPGYARPAPRPGAEALPSSAPAREPATPAADAAPAAPPAAPAAAAAVATAQPAAPPAGSERTAGAPREPRIGRRSEGSGARPARPTIGAAERPAPERAEGSSTLPSFAPAPEPAEESGSPAPSPAPPLRVDTGSVPPAEPPPLAAPSAGVQTVDAQRFDAQPPATLAARLADAAGSAPELDRIVEQVTRHLRPGVTRISIEVDPPELGRLAIRLVLRRGHLIGEIEAESPHVARTLEAGLHRLREALRDGGVPVDGFEVRSDDTSSAGHLAEGRPEAHGDGPGSRRFRGGGPEPPAQAADVPGANADVTVEPGRLDVVA